MHGQLYGHGGGGVGLKPSNREGGTVKKEKKGCCWYTWYTHRYLHQILILISSLYTL